MLTHIPDTNPQLPQRALAIKYVSKHGKGKCLEVLEAAAYIRSGFNSNKGHYTHEQSDEMLDMLQRLLDPSLHATAQVVVGSLWATREFIIRTYSEPWT